MMAKSMTQWVPEVGSHWRQEQLLGGLLQQRHRRRLVSVSGRGRIGSILHPFPSLLSHLLILPTTAPRKPIGMAKPAASSRIQSKPQTTKAAPRAGPAAAAAPKGGGGGGGASKAQLEEKEAEINRLKGMVGALFSAQRIS